MTKVKNFFKILFAWIFAAVFFLLQFVGIFIYYISKTLKIISMFLMTHWATATEDIRTFWSIYKDPEDI